MKRIMSVIVTVFIAGTMFVSCQSSAEKVDQAKENVVDAKQELNQAIKDSIVQFRKESAQQITAYEQSIADLKAKIATEKKDVKATYEKSLEELEQKNELLKTKLNDFKDEETDKWESFRDEFRKDMQDLGSAIKNFTVNNK